MGQWYKDKPNTISVLWTYPNPSLTIEYRSMTTTGSWITIGTPTSIGDDIFVIDYAFVAVDTYLVRVRDTVTGAYLVERISVIEYTLSNGDINNIKNIYNKRIFS